MFATLELCPKHPRGLLEHLRFWLSPPQVEVKPCTAFDTPYRRICVPVVDGDLDWGKISAIAEPILLPDNLLLPPDSGIQALPCPKYEQQLLLETVCAIVARSRIPIYRRVLGLIDPDGGFADMLPQLLRHYAMIRVLTRASLRYAQIAENMMAEMGAPVIYGEDADVLAGCVLILAPGQALGRGYPVPVLAGSQFCPPPGCIPITGLCPEVRPEICRQTPPGISPHRFAAALYDYGEVAAAAPQFAASMRCGYRRVTLEDMASTLAAAAAQSQV